MTRAVLTLSLVAGLVTRAAAQWLGVPVWNSPEGGGLTVSADYAKPNSDYGSGSTWGVRLSWGLGIASFTAGAASWQPGGGGESLTSIGGNAAFRIIGGTLPPIGSSGIRANVQLGLAHTEVANLVVSPVSGTAVTGALGFGVRLRAQYFSAEPYFSPGIRYRSVSGGGNSTEFGYAIGANVGFRAVRCAFGIRQRAAQGRGKRRRVRRGGSRGTVVPFRTAPPESLPKGS